MNRDLITAWESSSDLSEFFKSVNSIDEKSLDELKSYLLKNYQDEKLVEKVLSEIVA